MKRRDRRWVAAGALLSLGVVAGVAVVVAVTTSGLQRVDDDTASARDHLGLPPAGDAAGPSGGAAAAGPADASTFLVVGSDGDVGRDGQRADVLLLVRLPASGGRAVMVSLPRDLWVDDLCHGGRQRINAALNGCGEAVTGPQLTMLTVERVTGWPVDHYVGIGFDGFVEVVDAVGGMEICNDHPVRDRMVDLELPAGCVLADANQTLAWIRSRMTEEQVDGRWRTMPGVNDLARNTRQQDLLLQVVGEVAEVRSPATLRRLTAQLSDSVTLGNSLGLDELLSLAGQARELGGDRVVRGEVPVRSHVTSGGAQVLLPDGDLRALFAELAAGANGDDAVAGSRP